MNNKKLEISNCILSFRLAFESLSHNRGRSLLTIIGIVIGIAMVIIVMSVGAGVKGLILSEIANFGDNWIQIEVNVPSASKIIENSKAMASGVQITTLTLDDAESIKRLRVVQNLYAAITTQAVISRAEEKMLSIVFGVSAAFTEIDSAKVTQGRFFNEIEDKSAAPVVVLGSDVAESLFGNLSPLRETVMINGKQYTVIGVREPLGSFGFVNVDKIVYAPIRTVQKKLMGVKHVLWITAKLKSGVNPEFAAEEVTGLLRERHDTGSPDKDDFHIHTLIEAVKIVSSVVFAITTLLIILTGISLLVAGVGIMNVMYVSVAERTFEIGLRKALGARDKDIRNQFLLEAVMLTSVGGLIGIFVGASVSILVAVIARQAALSWDLHISIFSIVLSCLFALLVGIFFGLYPARQAAKLAPMEAMRVE